MYHLAFTSQQEGHDFFCLIKRIFFAILVAALKKNLQERHVISSYRYCSQNVSSLLVIEAFFIFKFSILVELILKGNFMVNSSVDIWQRKCLSRQSMKWWRIAVFSLLTFTREWCRNKSALMFIDGCFHINRLHRLYIYIALFETNDKIKYL